MGAAKSRAAAAAIMLLAAGPIWARVGEPAAPFMLKTYDGTEISLADLHGQVVVLNYWATWCGPCKAEMPAMDGYVRAHAGKGLRVFGIATEDSVPPYRLRPLASVLAYPLVARFRGSHYGILGGAVPTSYVIDRAGVIRYAKAGAFTAGSFDALITPLLNEGPPPPAVIIAAR